MKNRPHYKDSNKYKFTHEKDCIYKLRRSIYRGCSKKRNAILYPGYCDIGIIRYNDPKDGYRIIYDYDKMIYGMQCAFYKWNSNGKCPYKQDEYTWDDAYTDAVEWMEHNTLQEYTIYNRPFGPRVVYIDENGNESYATDRYID